MRGGLPSRNTINISNISWVKKEWVKSEHYLLVMSQILIYQYIIDISNALSCLLFPFDAHMLLWDLLSSSVVWLVCEFTALVTKEYSALWKYLGRKQGKAKDKSKPKCKWCFRKVSTKSANEGDTWKMARLTCTEVGDCSRLSIRCLHNLQS